MREKIRTIFFTFCACPSGDPSDLPRHTTLTRIIIHNLHPQSTMVQPSVRPLLLAALCLLSRVGTTDAFSSSHVPPSGRRPLLASTTNGMLVATTATSTRTTTTTTSTRTTTTTRLSSTVSSSSPPSSGVSKTTVVEGTGRVVRPGDAVVVRYRCTASGSDRPFARSDRQRVVAMDGSMIRGWDVAIRTMREGERSTVRVIDPAYAYGPGGVPPFVPPNAELVIDLEILNIEEDVMGGGSLSGSADIAGLDGMLDGPASRPRTPAAIAAAYERRMREKAASGAPPEREGIEGWIDKVRGSYFFGLFEGETGQEAPWYLTPSITFPIAFAVVGLAFWVSLAGGAISERGMPTTDELDEIIVSSDLIRFGIAVAMNDVIRA